MTKSAADTPRLLIEARGPVEWVTLNRPDALNALNPGMIEDLRDYFLGLPDRRDVRIVVLRGAGARHPGAGASGGLGRGGYGP